MENLLQKDPGINLVYTINEPAAAGAYEAIKAAGKEKDVTIVSVDGGCPGVENVKKGVIGATSQQYPLKMAEMGVQAIVDYSEGRVQEARADRGQGLHGHRRDADHRRSAGRRGVRGHRVRPRELLGLELMAKNPLRRLTPATATEGPASLGPGSAESRPAGLGVRIHDILHSNATLGPAIVLLLAVLIFAATTDRFLEPANLSLIVQQVMVVGTLGIAQTLVILTAGIDLSVGAIMVLSSIVMAKLSAESGVPGLLALLIGFGVGTVVRAASTACSSRASSCRRSSSRSARSRSSPRSSSTTRRAPRSAAPTCRACCCGPATPSTSGTRGSPTARY